MITNWAVWLLESRGAAVMKELLIAICILPLVNVSVHADFNGAAIAVDAKQNASGVVLSCVSTQAVIKGYKAAMGGNINGALSAGCVLVPDGAAVMVDCGKTGRKFARIKFKGRELFGERHEAA